MRQWWIWKTAHMTYAGEKDPRTSFRGNSNCNVIAHVVEFAEYERLEGELELFKAYRSATGKITDEVFNEMVERVKKLKHLLETIVRNSQHADTRIPAEFVDEIREALKLT